MANEFTEYEEFVMREIVRHELQPNMIEQALSMAGSPASAVLEAARNSQFEVIRKIEENVEGAVVRALTTSINMANRAYSDRVVLDRFDRQGICVNDIDDIRNRDIEGMDTAAKSFGAQNAVMLSAEGILMGAAAGLGEMLPFAQFAIPSIIAADVLASITLLSRSACQVAACYGRSSRLAENIPHILACMAPLQQTSDEGYIMMKGAITSAIREAGAFLAEKASQKITQEMIEKEAPALIRLIAMVASRLSVTITEKELGILVPVAGGFINSGLNLAFQQAGQITSMDYFRRMTLEERHGDRAVSERIKLYSEEMGGGSQV